MEQIDSEEWELSLVNEEIYKLAKRKQELMTSIAKRKPFFDWNDWSDPMCFGNWLVIGLVVSLVYLIFAAIMCSIAYYAEIGAGA
jgi:hypothetical protein